MIEVSCSVEGDYVPHTAAMLDSVIEHSGELGVRVHYLHGPDLAETDATLLAQMLASRGAECAFIRIEDDTLAGLPTAGFTGKSTWYRLLLPELLPQLDRVLHLDADLLATDALAPLWATELGEHYVAAVTNVFMTWHLHRPAELGLAGPEHYFNAGVLLMNLAALRDDDQTNAMLRYARLNADRLDWRDQDTLNVMLGHRRLALHPRWNCMNALVDYPHGAEVFGSAVVEEARRHPALRHYEGPAANKPWHYMSDRAAQRAYRRHRRRTPWPEVRLEGRSLGNFLRRTRARVRP